MNESIILVSHALCPYVQRVAIALAEKDVAHERRVVDLANKPQWFLEISPLGRTPVLKVGDAALFESAAILEFLEETQPAPLHPADPVERAGHRAWIGFGSECLNDIAGFYSAADTGALETKAAALRARFERIEGHLVAGPWFGGARFSLVDAVFAPVRAGVFDFEGTPDKVKKLHEMEDSTATVLTRYYLVRMTPEQRRQPAMVEVIAEYLMRQGNYAAAEEANTRLLDSKDTAQIRFWKAWSEAAKQETEKAIATLKDLREKYPDSDWSTHGSVYANELSQVDKHTAAYANALVDATDKIKAGIGVFEGEFFYRKADAVFDIKVAYVADESMELLVKRDGKPMLGYRVKGDESWLFLESEEKIRHYKEGSIIPAPTLAMGPKATGGLQYNMGFRFVQNFEQLGQAIDAIAKAEGMGEEKVLANLLTAVLRSGSVPTSSKRDGGVTHYTWLSPNVQAPKFDRTTYALDGSGKFTSFAGGKYESRYMKYGKKGELTPQMNFTWPKKETETLERPGLQEFRDLMQEVLEVFRDGEELEEAE